MTQCKQHAAGKCGAELCLNGRRPRCALYAPARKQAAYGWDVTVQFARCNILYQDTFHWRGCTETAARRKGMLKTHAQSITAVAPLTEAEWIRAYGDPRLKNES